MFRDELVVRNIHEEVGLFEILQHELESHSIDDLLGRAGHLVAPNNDAARDILLFENRDELAHGLDTNIAFNRIKHKQTLFRIVAVRCEKVEAVAVDNSVCGHFRFESIKVDINLVISDFITLS